jgi:hypothetical protein
MLLPISGSLPMPSHVYVPPKGSNNQSVSGVPLAQTGTGADSKTAMNVSAIALLRNFTADPFDSGPYAAGFFSIGTSL